MTPLITIQCLGAVYRFNSARLSAAPVEPVSYLDTWEDNDIIDL